MHCVRGICVTLVDEARRGPGLQGDSRSLRRLEEADHLQALRLGQPVGFSRAEHIEHG